MNQIQHRSLSTRVVIGTLGDAGGGAATGNELGRMK
jgi:hypothetical protein